MSLEQYQAECAAGKIAAKDREIAELRAQRDSYIKELRRLLTESKEAHNAALESGRAEYARRLKVEVERDRLRAALMDIAGWGYNSEAFSVMRKIASEALSSK